ncbi:MAG TPA: PAAR-like domain-containing protein [Gemmatimonadota bacterium]|nr:PAAR-like domain-containing protein [Gemmatimonadota bacterium]
MAVTINVNGLSLVHKGSDGYAKATLPDVCKTPPNNVPVPYPNTAFTTSLSKGSVSVTADGGNMIAVKGSEFSTSIGDEPGTGGGVKSGVNMKEATWLSYSPDVKIEGKSVCRKTDKMLMNHGNTVCLAGEQQMDVVLKKIMDIICPKFCQLAKRARAGEKLKPGETWTRKLYSELGEKADDLARLGLRFEKSAVVAAVKGAASRWKRKAIRKFGTRFGAKLVTKAIPYVGWAMVAWDIYDAATLAKMGFDLIRVRPDFVLDADGAKLFGDIKFPGDSFSPGQEESFRALNGGKDVPVIDEASCKCK